MKAHPLTRLGCHSDIRDESAKDNFGGKIVRFLPPCRGAPYSSYPNKCYPNRLRPRFIRFHEA